MAGRVALLEMGPLSQNEICGKASNFPFTIDREEIIHRMSGRAKEGEDEIFERIYEGSLPGYVGKCDRDERFRDVFFASYARLYLDRDVREEVPGINMSLFYDFLRGVACLVGQTLNVHALALDVGVSDDTAKRWFSVLEKSGMIFYLNSYSNNLLTRTVKMKKVYFFDTGVAAYLTRQASPGIMRDSPYSGAILENYVISEIRKTYMNSGRQFDMYYYRDVNNKEIDLILEEGGMLHPVEIKKNSFPTRAMVSNFSVLRKSSVPTGEGAVICMSESFSVLDDGTLVVPVWAI
ncbi:MAG: DUF4143 domain-containing protein [Clostridia bacterium]|nr:DUF4143 domain-containing protein [Clostridia bacterium]